MQLEIPQQGVTLWELLLVVAIAATLAFLAAPGFAELRRGARMTSSVNQMVGTLHLARSEAIMRGIPTAVCLSADGTRCLERAATSATGWLVFHEISRSSPVQRSDAEPPLRQVALPEQMAVRGTRAAVTFWPSSRAGTTSTFTFCHADSPHVQRAVIVSQTGRPRVASPDTAKGASCPP